MLQIIYEPKNNVPGVLLSIVKQESSMSSGLFLSMCVNAKRLQEILTYYKIVKFSYNTISTKYYNAKLSTHVGHKLSYCIDNVFILHVFYKLQIHVHVLHAYSRIEHF